MTRHTPQRHAAAVTPLLTGLDLRLPGLRALYQDLHAHPELSFQEGFEGIQTATGALAQRFTTVLSSPVTVKAHRAEKPTSASLTRDAEHITDGMLSAARLQSVVIPVMSLGQEVAFACIMVAGGVRISHGDLSLADFIAFLLYLLQLVTPITIMVMGLGRLQTGLAAKGRFEDLLGTPVETPGELDAPRSAAGSDAVVFDRVSFGYDGEPVLREISLRVPRRGLTAVVGHSGAGKSTLLTLIERFEDASSGSVTVLGQDVRDWSLDALCSQIGYVDQSFTLLEGTIRENLLLGRTDTGTDDSALMATLADVEHGGRGTRSPERPGHRHRPRNGRLRRAAAAHRSGAGTAPAIRTHPARRAHLATGRPQRGAPARRDPALSRVRAPTPN